MDTPVTFIMGDIMSEDEFFRFCQMNDTLSFERDSEGNIIFMSPAGSFSDNFNFEISLVFGSWLRENKIPGKAFGPSAGFTLPNRAVRSPDVAWVSREKWDALSRDEQERFAPLCPDFVIEVRSKSDSLIYLQNKMQEYLANGCRLAWLIDRYGKKVYVYEAERAIVEYSSLDIQLSGEPLFPGFVLNLAEIEK
ncbi:Uma2 family endonuclease [Dyadobacter sp. BE34]|uniref:Uma2 family endonuclease n=1 Tax=Dyadobacter fermentans TaxID=94254 RepID=A0ABU1R678_9BACT|nr:MULTISPECIES: Uma2 family endonuclease [Dyadobacter]MDR6808419.1 Uma2 family endonuclease [Dyadobacter fermentans]MDR7045764.1 Uma2 family endonuclease [Dyadobacter sp. BE242]MDR7200077.1 Uma2 family endonuclease [Dyadobacter sp. BE34]MDR7218037.1 Uma2 family endonuclease [Dyadobacter sp. BE31]MDR7265968.1 Uma2 family endonuclease [Dyadobacter sp. BE32]